jgi:hypothetical protein
MELTCKNIPHALVEVGWLLKTVGVVSDSRNGEVIAAPGPFTLTILRPTERVLLDPERDANPFFHLAETVWMFAGGQGVEFLTLFNKRMAEYSDDGTTLHGAYGHRWRKHFYRDQIMDTIALLRSDPDTRRAVIAMWDAEVDGRGDGKDYPCNTHIYFRMMGGTLEMTLCNRSNDVVWGMLGANAVHMTYLHELIARGVGAPVGAYRVFTNNAHTYLANPYTEHLLALRPSVDGYAGRGLTPTPLLHGDELPRDLLADCKRAVMQPYDSKFTTVWMQTVYAPVRDAWFARKAGDPDYRDLLLEVVATDWRVACLEWCARRVNP